MSEFVNVGVEISLVTLGVAVDLVCFSMTLQSRFDIMGDEEWF